MNEIVQYNTDTKIADNRDMDVYLAREFIKNPNDPKGPLKSLQGFKRTHIAAGETQTISFELTPKAFWSFNDETQTMEVLPGKYEILY